VEEKKQQSKRTTSKTPRATSAAAGVRAKTGTAKKGTASSTKTRSTKAAAPASPTAKKKAASKKAPPAPPVDTNTLRREASKQTALAIAQAALDKKAERVEIVDIGEKVDYSDYLVVMTGRSDRQVVAIARGIEEALEKNGVKTVGREGMPQGHWVLLDFADVIVHIFLDEARKYYDLEGLWLDAPRVPTPSFNPPPAAAS
jgi:ribosome-associated protein